MTIYAAEPGSPTDGPSRCWRPGRPPTSRSPPTGKRRRSHDCTRTTLADVLDYSPLPAREFMKPILETTNLYPLRAGVGISFAGEVAYARMLHAELRVRGIHVGHTAIGGRVAPGGDHEPADVADVLWRHHTERSDFQIRLGIE